MTGIGPGQVQRGGDEEDRPKKLDIALRLDLVDQRAPRQVTFAIRASRAGVPRDPIKVG